MRARLCLAMLLVLPGCREGAGSGPDAQLPEPVDLGIAGYPAMPADNPLTREGIDLGRKLFNDRILSESDVQACADCHRIANAFADTLRLSVGARGAAGSRNAPSLVNAGWLPNLFWDGRAASLEAQALEPVANPLEMNLPWDQAVRKLSARRDYPALFAAAFAEEGITREKVAKALAQFERTLVSFDSRFDRFQRGEASLTPAESSGYALFNQDKTGCFHCHKGPLFTDMAFHNNGLDLEVDGTGRGAVTGNPDDDGKFRTPTLRNLVLTPPYMHDGRMNSLEEVMEHYSSGGKPSRTADTLIARRTQYPLSEEEVQDVVAFLKTLTDSPVAK
jgi:cytochrome c peroxidase